MNKRTEINTAALEAIEGAKGGKGGGGGGRPAYEAPNTIASRSIVRIIDVVSQGEIEGIVGGAQGIYLNDTPLKSAGSFNFYRASYDYRVGLPDQPYMPGFPQVESEISVGTVVSSGTPVVRTVSAPNIDAVRVTIALTQGLYVQDTSNGDMSGTSVSFAIDHKLTSSGAWTQVDAFTISGKTTTTAERQYLIQRPVGTGLFDIRVRRLTPDSTVSTLRNEIALSRITEIQDIKQQYNDIAYVGLAADAEAFGNQPPRRWYLVKGIRCKIPSNYNPTSRTYSGLWDGTFQVAWTDNPAWCLYDILTNVRYGMGEFITDADIDKYSFYDAAVYNDGLVPDGNGGLEPRFTFNAVLNSREEAGKILNLMASSMRCSLLWAAGKVTLLQDRPADHVADINNANVIDGRFEYKSSGLLERHTAFNVTFNDRSDRYLQRIVTVDASTTTGTFAAQLLAAQDRYGYNPVEIQAVGATTEGQAIRAGMWALDTELNQTEIVQFKVGMDNFDLLPGDVIKLFDRDYTTTEGAGRIRSVSGTTVELDRPITLVPGSRLEVQLADGTTLEERNIVETSGTLSTVTVTAPFSQPVLEHAVWIARLAVEPRQFRIVGVRQEEDHILAVEALLHDPGKYARVEGGFEIPAPIFSAAQPVITNAPTALTFREISVNDTSDGLGGQRRSLLVSWVAPSLGIVGRYVLRHRFNSGEWTNVEVSTPSYEIAGVHSGTYEVQVLAVSAQGNPGPTVNGTYVVTTAGGATSVLNAPINLQIPGGGSNFSGVDLTYTFTNPSTNLSVESATLRDFEVRFIDPGTSAILRTVYLPAVAAGSSLVRTYTLADNLADGGPRRSVRIEVRCRDTSNNLSSPAAVTFTNPVPSAVTDLTVVGSLKSNRLQWVASVDSDLAGYLVWRGTTPTFTPSAANLVQDGMTTSFNDAALPDSTTYYYKVAAYDRFARPTDGAGLNISTTGPATTLDPAVSNEYRVTGVLWTPNSPAPNSLSWTACKVIKVGGTGTGTEWDVTAGNAAWTSGVLFVYYVEGASTFSVSTSQLDAIGTNKTIVATYRGGSNLEYGDGRAYIDGGLVLASTVGAAQLVTGTAVITETAQIANAIIDTANIKNAAIKSAQIDNLAVTTAKIQDLSVETIKIASGAITTAYSATGGSNTASVTVPIPAGARSVTAMAFLGGEYRRFVSTIPSDPKTGGGGGTAEYYRTFPALGTVSASSTFGSNTGVGSSALQASNPVGGTFTFTATRVVDDGNGGAFWSWRGAITIVVLVTQR